MPSARSRLRDALAGARAPLPEPVLRAGWRAYEWALAVRGALSVRGATRAPDGLPLPPASLRVLVSGDADPNAFLETGRAHNDFIRALLGANGIDVTTLDSILDLGCGCGRVTRWWQDVDGPTIHGCDYNPKLVAWCRSGLPFARVVRNELLPPLPYEAATLDHVYAISVFTHLTEAQQDLWLSELARVVRPGGTVLFTVMGEFYAERLSGPERERFDAGEVVTRFEGLSGTNMCATYHPPAYVTRRMLGERFELLDSVQPLSEPERTADRLGQDSYLIRRTAT